MTILMGGSALAATGPLHPWGVVARSTLQACTSESTPLNIQDQIAYIEVTTGMASHPVTGWFLLDSGTTQSMIDRHFIPNISNYTTYYPETFSFFGAHPNMSLAMSDFSRARADVPQAGIIGSDFMAQSIYTFDYQNRVLTKAEFASTCTSDVLSSAGLVAMDTSGYFSTTDVGRVSIGQFLSPNVPTIPIRIGEKSFPAQIDLGYNDWKYPYAININLPLKKALDDAGINLIPEPRLNSVLSTCVVGVSDQITAYRLPAGQLFALLGLDGKDINQYANVHIFLKNTPDAAKVCGGISSWDKPAAQLGGSFFKNAGYVVFDAHTSKVWIPKAAN